VTTAEILFTLLVVAVVGSRILRWLRGQGVGATPEREEQWRG
jgi:hypothetical protein